MSSTPSCRALAGPSITAADSPSASNARRKLSATPMRSRARLETPYARASATSRSVRRRKFSISASARRPLSLYSSTSFASAVASGGAGALSAVVAVLVLLSLAVAAGSVIMPFPQRLPDERPAYQCFADKNQAWPRSQSLRGRQQLADDLGGVVNHRNDAGVIEPGRADDPDHADDPSGRIPVGSDNGR